MKILSTNTVFSSRYFKVNRNNIERNGKTFTKDFIERVTSVFIIPYDNDGIYIESQYRDAYNKKLIEVVAGKIEKNDAPLDSAKRELLEEAGLTAKKWKKIAEWDLSANMLAKIYVFVATDLEVHKQQLDEDEEIEIIKMPVDKVVEKIENGEITVASNVAALLLFAKLKKEGKL
jgi:ADP-ribose pyrophosphatase